MRAELFALALAVDRVDPDNYSPLLPAPLRQANGSSPAASLQRFGKCAARGEGARLPQARSS